MKTRLGLAALAALTTSAFADTIIVNNRNDTGDGSLRQAILNANANSVPDDIVFNIPGNGILGSYPISPVTPLPPITGNGTRILGETQRAFGGDRNPNGPEIVLGGGSATEPANGLTISANDCLVRELSIRGFSGPNFSAFGNGIVINGANNAVENCVIGTSNATNTADGIRITGARNVVGGSASARNIISGNTRYSVRINGPAATNNRVENNYMGTDATGQVPILNGLGGVAVGAARDNVVANNVIAGGTDGVTIASFNGEEASGNVVRGNFIGTNADGTAGGFGNTYGVSLAGTKNVIGGLSPSDRNIISGNGIGISFNNVGNKNVIQGNYIGTDVSGTKAIPNRPYGMSLAGSDNVVGGTSSGARNIISGNQGSGIELHNAAKNNIIQGNYIGTDVSGTQPLPNARFDSVNPGHGISFSSTGGTDGNLIGGPETGAGNIIAFNTDAGIGIESLPSVSGALGNAIRANSIFSNGGLGIDLFYQNTGGGVTPNDEGDGDVGGNNHQNFPVVTGAFGFGGELTVYASFNSVALQSYTIELFANDLAEQTGPAEGRYSLGSLTVQTDANGDACIAAKFPLPSGVINVTATATDGAGNTSEFSPAFDIVSAAPTDPPCTPSTVTPPATGKQLLNISTRLRVRTGDQVLIGGFIITGNVPKRVIVRGLGPSLGDAGVAGSLSDPTLTLFSGETEVATNDNWTQNRAEIEATTIPPSNELEAAIVETLQPGFYTAVVAGSGGATGIGLVEVYDLTPDADTRLANISTRGIVETEEDVMIGGLIVGPEGNGTANVVVRAVGPSLEAAGVTGTLQDPTLELRNGSGDLVAENDNWKTTEQAEIVATGLAPSDERESVISGALQAGAYTAVIRGKDGTTGVALVEAYNLQ